MLAMQVPLPMQMHVPLVMIAGNRSAERRAA